jgi:gliding motility-associated-like protein
MNLFKYGGFLVLFIWMLSVSTPCKAQIQSAANQIVPTEYASGNQDNIHIFCVQKGEVRAALTAKTTGGESGTFEWQKFNAATNTFTTMSVDGSGSSTSALTNLENGGYRVIITTAAGVKTFTSWVFNNYLEAKAEITDSDCYSLKLKGSFDTQALIYTDLSTNKPLELNKGIQVKWMDGQVVVSRVLAPEIYNPPTKDTNYSFTVTDRFGCDGNAEVNYISIVTKAAFSVSTEKGEAPLEVTFENKSENGDPGKFEWFIFRDLDEIKREAAENNGKVKDSIMVKLYNDSPVYTFEKSGSYKVKLVSSKKNSANQFCYDTTYLAGYIVADTSFVDAPNVFTPDGNGTNDEFIIKFWSMKSIKITIFNRWGKVLHVWESGNVINFDNTVKSVPQSVWDGKVGGRLSSPGVYYYVVEGIGRDDRRRRTSGFFHLFRGK